MNIIVPPNLTVKEFNQLLLKCYSKQITEGQFFKFNFSNTAFISSYGMVLFVLLCEELIKLYSCKINLILSKPETKSYIKPCIHIAARLGLFHCLPEEVTCYPYKPNGEKNFGKNDTILEVTRIKNFEVSKRVIERIERALLKNTNYPKEQIKDICLMVSEIVQNIFYHSKTKKEPIISVQKYSKLNMLQLVIADSGLGIPGTLKLLEAFKNLSDSNLIVESLKEGVSRYKNKGHRGEGLFRCEHIANKHKSMFYIRSNKGALMVDSKKK